MYIGTADDAPRARPGRASGGMRAGLNVLNFVDRQPIAGLAGFLVDEFHLSRSQIGLLAEFAFVIAARLSPRQADKGGQGWWQRRRDLL